jgi:hypothetical protein
MLMQHQLVNDGTITAIVGSSGSGKTAWLKKKIAQVDRLLVWDIEGQYNEKMQVITTKKDLVKAIQQHKARISYQPKTLSDFDFWAKCAFTFAQLGAELSEMTNIVAEELADVTSPAKAPEAWGMLLRRGRKYGANIYGITQRPSESDKTLFGNCHVIHCCYMQRANDRQYMARELDLPASDIQKLNRAKLEYIHKDMRSNELDKGRLTF